MIHPANSSALDPVKASGNSYLHEAGPEEEFSVTMADKLLQTTRQYSKWETIRQKDAYRAEKIASLVLERHAYVAGRYPATEEGRKRFDEITEQLRILGIRLYRSDQFKNPIFPGPNAQEKEEKTQAAEPALSPRALELRDRFAKKDCYEFLAGILEENGIAYYGKGGIASSLIDRARAEGKRPNIYLTGEAVTGLLCQKPVVVHIPRVTRNSFEGLWKKIEPHLRAGAILSYSSKHFGHTGIVDRTNDRWVYINSSGPINARSKYQVLEEDLRSEIRGWLRRAERKDVFLNVTLGVVNRELTARFERHNFSKPGEYGPEINLLA